VVEDHQVIGRRGAVDFPRQAAAEVRAVCIERVACGCARTGPHGDDQPLGGQAARPKRLGQVRGEIGVAQPDPRPAQVVDDEIVMGGGDTVTGRLCGGEGCPQVSRERLEVDPCRFRETQRGNRRWGIAGHCAVSCSTSNPDYAVKNGRDWTELC
jgi:hypothetical protein